MGERSVFTARWLLGAVMTCANVTAFAASDDRYLVEVLVFRHVDADATAEPVSELRDFNRIPGLEESLPPEAPAASAEIGQTFQNLWARLRRVNGYEPLAMASWTQSQIDYQPPVRLHDAQVLTEELRLPGPVFWIDPAGQPLLSEFIHPMYRLDGSVQLRRSRFLHIELDLEYRIGEPSSAFIPPSLGADGSLVTSAPDAVAVEPTPYQVHHLAQSRQVKTNEIHYFDTAFLGALVRVTPVEGG